MGQGADPRIANAMGEDAAVLVARLGGVVPATRDLLLDLLEAARKQ